MPPKNKRQAQLTDARAKKRTSLESVAQRRLEEEMDGSDKLYSPESTFTTDSVREHVQSWISALDRDDLMSLSLLLHEVLVNEIGIQMTPASEVIGKVLNKSGRTVREWRAAFHDNDGCFPDSLQGKYQRQGDLWNNEGFNRKASLYIRESASVNGRPNLTSDLFCQWVNNELLPSEVLGPGFPHSVSVQTARMWMHELGFSVIDKKKGIYIDRHKRPDVVEYRKKFLRKMITCGMLTPSHASTDEAQLYFSEDIEAPRDEQVAKSVIIYHDKSILNANEDESVQWGTLNQHIMVSEFIEEKGGYLSLSSEQFAAAKETNPNIQKSARVLLEYGEAREGYWTSQRFMHQMEIAVAIAELNTQEKKATMCIVFYQSLCHKAYGEDALNVDKMNVRPGGGQPKMHDTIYQGKVQTMVSDGTPKGMAQILRERGVNITNMRSEDM